MFNDPSDHAPIASIATLRLRANVLRSVRQFFHTRGYWEVDTPLLSHDTTVDTHLDPFVVLTKIHSQQGNNPPGDKAELFLQTSPEFAMKRLLAAGADAIYQITHALRAEERGKLHNQEFTIIEWYRVGDTHQEQMELTETLIQTVYGCIRDQLRSSPTSRCEQLESRLASPFSRISYDAAFERYAGSTVLDRSCAQLAQLARERGLAVPASLRVDDRDEWLNFLLTELVTPRLGESIPEFLYDYPASQAALAQIRHDTPAVAERFELYDRGIELCNGYHELTDADELRMRIQQQNAARIELGKRPLPPDSRLLCAMDAGLPECSGVALGFDRLLMLALGEESIDDVMAFPFERA